MKRSIIAILTAPFKPQFQRAFVEAFRVFERPVSVLFRYIFATGNYPITYQVVTPIGHVKATVYSSADVTTLVECFAKIDYPAQDNIECVVDFGSNIGLSALYFLSRNTDVHVYLFEPVPENLERLENNLAPYSGRFTLNRTAVSIEDGFTIFGIEKTGRYGGIGLKDLEDNITVEVVDIARVLDEILHASAFIDIIKLDVEGLEQKLLNALPDDALHRTARIYAETFGNAPDLPGFHRSEWGAITQYTNAAISQA